MFGAQARSGRATMLIAGSVLLLILFIGLAFNHLDYWGSSPSKPHAYRPLPSEPEPLADAELRSSFIDKVLKSKIKVDADTYSLYGAFNWKLPGKPLWTEPLGENLCIIDLDNRPFDKPGEIFADTPMTWNNASEVNGLSVGILNHWLYAKIHGYRYYYIEIEEYEDRRTSWKKPPVMSEILKHHDACIYLDSDAIFHRLDLPFEWLMNYWQVHPSENSLALAFDPVADNNMDKFGKVYLNTGFIIAQNNERTFEVMKAWQQCPDDDSVHPGCKDFRLNHPGRPTDQGGFGTYIRYDYAEDIKELPCDEANGYLESGSGCNGRFIEHLWTGKSTHIKVAVGEQLPGDLLEVFHRRFTEERNDYYFTEAELFAGKAHTKPAAANIDGDSR
ncbi:Nucleotide-diphospho-sugar transferase [Geosmithia morbida]|uniref:Nucleotide-diphospho-sugar transferase n=1 Tax=Geosmithia morbida TaxID=1094350 RepID=A0A9P5D3P6_9HYPO|nr:Nucleotide-diphospho-sugar transferase [Geosmithia morbida]KAF4122000.1 Nucleotide-diphospho-sugar transferase [Geosmithia morbida]